VADTVSSPHGRRFGIAYLVLSAALGAAIGTSVLLIERGPPPPPPPWSSWRPTQETALQRAREIASHIAPRYQLPNGDRLVRVQVGDPSNTKERISVLAVSDKPRPQTLRDFDGVDVSKAMMYVLCGKAPDCSIAAGEPSPERLAVLRREALELALYTFRYVDGIDSVVTFFPPKERKETPALFFRRDDLEAQLDQPLRQTLPNAVPPVPGKLPMSAFERKAINELTVPREFRYQLTTAQGERLLLLAPNP
jgi:hypothetical protein